MDIIDYWRLCEELSVIQAACLIVGVDPNDYSSMTTRSAFSFPDTFDPNPPTKPAYAWKEIETVFTTLKNAIKGNRLSAAVSCYDVDESYD